MTTFEKIVKGATKIKLAPPKPKYIEPILLATAEGQKSESFRVIMRTLASRLEDSAWSIVYKALIVLHIMIREGDENVTIDYLAKHTYMLDCNNIRKTSGSYIANGGDLKTLVNYSKYLKTRSVEYSKVKHDYIKEVKKPISTWSSKDNGTRLRTVSVEKGLLREIESVQKQIDSLIKCKFSESEVNNDVVILGFRMLVNDLLTLYESLNEGIINILEHFFELSKIDAERAFEIYKHFTKETEQVVSFLRVAKHLEHITKLHVPTIKHAQTGLTSSLEEYLNDSSFEINRRQYLAEKASKESNRPSVKADNKESKNSSTQDQQQSEAQQHATLQQQQQQASAMQQLQQPFVQQDGLIFQQTGFNPFATSFTPGLLNNQPMMQEAQFTGMVQNQQPQQQPAQPQATAQQFIPQPQQLLTNQFSGVPLQQQQLQQQITQPSPQQPMFTGAGFGGFGSQPTQAPVVEQQMTGSNNIFGVASPSQLPMRQVSVPSLRGSLNRTSSANPFALNGASANGNPLAATNNMTGSPNPFATSRFSENSNTTAYTFESQQRQKILPTATGTNPFRSAEPISTNMNTNNGFTHQQPLKRQPTAGGLERLPTVPVFPETQREQYELQLKLKAEQELQQRKMMIQQQQQQQQLAQQSTGFNLFSQQPQQQPQMMMSQFTGMNMNGSSNVAQPQQQQFTGFANHAQPQQQSQQLSGQVTGFNPFAQQMQQQQPQQFSGVYSGPNLL